VNVSNEHKTKKGRSREDDERYIYSKENS